MRLRPTGEDDIAVALDCFELAAGGLLKLASERDKRFLGKVEPETASCRGGKRGADSRATPWVDWAQYWGTGDTKSLSDRDESDLHLTNRNTRGVDGALLDLEYQRMELIRFNLFDNRTFEEYAGEGGAMKTSGRRCSSRLTIRKLKNLKIVADGSQTCQGDAIRFRTLTGICNDIRNPAMGSTGQLFARNVEFEATFPDLRAERARREPARRIARACFSRTRR